MSSTARSTAEQASQQKLLEIAPDTDSFLAFKTEVAPPIQKADRIRPDRDGRSGFLAISRTAVIVAAAGTVIVLIARGTGSTRTEMPVAEAGPAIDLAQPPPPTAPGQLEFASDPEGARITVDGVFRGVTPLTIAGVDPGTHDVVIASADGSFTRAITVRPGTTATVVASFQPAAPVAAVPRPPAAAARSRIYTESDSSVRAPVELSRQVPSWTPGPDDPAREFRGVLELVIDESGNVISAVSRGAAPPNDDALRTAALQWKYLPAMLPDGTPVRYRKLVGYLLKPGIQASSGPGSIVILAADK